MSWLTLSVIGGLITAGLAAVGGWVKWGKPFKELTEVFTAVQEAMADGKLTGPEIKRILDEADDVLPALRGTIKK